MTEPSKTRTSFYRRLYVAHLISQGIDSIPAIMAATGMPRRTAQDTLAALAELDIHCAFEQTEGARHLQGHYRIGDWGPINPAWIAAQLDTIKQTLGYP
ncbi:winged helix-turn-helix domain-containing protein [Aeromonas encheleia]|uniref:Winged helix-turn-helix domain-containing protein n=1 Tax=Aeromonas encheleia TaxID=73010 RepID=A0AAE9SB16_9GAMM|nr:winged helix-turn-helix domain-containing protein [Aeromonas encheleia]USV56378.1 winged helix-turn-helix domain-containing protein [Aeromonas encheleia]